MEPERIKSSQRERDFLQILHEVEEGRLRQVEAARQLRLTDGHVRRLIDRLRAEGDRGVGIVCAGDRRAARFPNACANAAVSAV